MKIKLILSRVLNKRRFFTLFNSNICQRVSTRSKLALKTCVRDYRRTYDCQTFVFGSRRAVLRQQVFFAVHIQVDESEIKTPWFGHISGDFESGI